MESSSRMMMQISSRMRSQCLGCNIFDSIVFLLSIFFWNLHCIRSLQAQKDLILLKISKRQGLQFHLELQFSGHRCRYQRIHYLRPVRLLLGLLGLPSLCKLHLIACAGCISKPIQAFIWTYCWLTFFFGTVWARFSIGKFYNHFSLMKVCFWKGLKLKCQWQTMEIFFHMKFVFEW